MEGLRSRRDYSGYGFWKDHSGFSEKRMEGLLSPTPGGRGNQGAQAGATSVCLGGISSSWRLPGLARGAMGSPQKPDWDSAHTVPFITSQ